jgi:hypothetical protein
MDYSVYEVSLVMVIVVLVEFCKRFGLSTRWLPLLNIVLGLAAAFVYMAPGDPKQAVIVGLVIAFSAMGLWSGAKNTNEKLG